MIKSFLPRFAAAFILLSSTAAFAQVVDICPDKKSKDAIHAQLTSALIEATAENNGGFGLNMWGTVVNRDGLVCAVAFSGQDRGD